MSGPFMFGVVRERLTRKEINRRVEIAKRHGAEFVWCGSIPGSETRGWFECQNQGEPFNSAVARVVMSEVNP